MIYIKECFYLKSSHPKGLYEAQQEGYTACHYCNGTSDETIDVNYDTEIAYEADKHNEIRAIPIALVIGIFLYIGIRNSVKQKEIERLKQMKESKYSSVQRNAAWQVYRYFIANEDLLSEDENRILYERARTMLIDIYGKEKNDYDVEAVERAIHLVAVTQNKHHPNETGIDCNIAKILNS